MTSENTEAQVKARIIERINHYRETAIMYGFDYPTQEPTQEDSAIDLLNFLEEIVDYVAYNQGFNDAANGVEPEVLVTH